MKLNLLGQLIMMSTYATYASHIEDIQSRGWLVCGIEINHEPEGNHLNEHNEVEGFQANNCRALAVALLNDIHAVQYIDVSNKDAIALLKSEEIDVLYPSSPLDQAQLYVNELTKVTNNQYIMHSMNSHPAIPRSIGPITHKYDEELNRIIHSVISSQLYADELNINSQNVSDVFSPLDEEHVFYQIADGAQHSSFSINNIKQVLEAVGNYSEMYFKHIDGTQANGQQAKYNNVYKFDGKLHLPSY